MLDPQKIFLSRVKQAYCLNEHEAQSLLHELSPCGVFPYELWGKAYLTYWKYPAAECSRLYKVENPSFPEICPQPVKHCPADVYAKWIVNFFFELAVRIPVKYLEIGFDYIVKSTYDNEFAVSEADKEYLFYPLMLAEKSISNAARTEGLKDIDVKLSSPNVLFNIFPDTIVVDKIAAIHYLSVIQTYPLRQEVKGITQSLVDSVVKAAEQKTQPVPEASPTHSEPDAATSTNEQQNTILIPRTLWENKKPQQICDDMRVAGYADDAPIAHVLYYWAGIKNYTEIGTVLRGNSIGESARYKHAQKKLDEAKGRYYTE